MIGQFKERKLSAVVLVPLALMVTVLAYVQYRWSNQVSEATDLRLADSLQMSIINWHQDLFRDLSHICEITLLDREDTVASDLQRYTRSLAAWRSTAHYQDLVSNLYIARAGANDAELLKFDPANAHLQPEPWPDRLNVLRQELAHALDTSPMTTVAGQATASTNRGPVPYLNGFYPAHLLKGWQFEPHIPALMYPMTDKGATASATEWIVVELNEDVLRNKVFPDLARRYFAGTDGLDFQLAIVGGSPRHVIYSSDPGFGERPIPDADGVLNVFGRSAIGTPGSPLRVFHDTSADIRSPSPLDVSWFPIFREQPYEQDWQLFVRHRRGGPLGAFAAELRHRNLTVSFGILLLLVVSMAMLLIATRRAQSLARLQMDFVTTVSHEVRTPLAVISSAADNIARGVVDEKQHVSQYGFLIQGQVQRLSTLIEQVLLFTAMRQGRQFYALRSIDINEVISASLSVSSNLPLFSRCTVETDVEPGLPPVMGDPALLSQCIQNLISNALKYGGSDKWIGVSARLNGVANEKITEGWKKPKATH